MNVEEYCIENNKQELLKQFMSDIDFMLNMGGPETAILTKYNDKKHLFTFKCHVCNTTWEGSANSYIVEELGCPKCNANSNPVKIKYASRGKGQITLDEYCDDHGEDGKRLRAEFDDENNELTREEAFLLSYGSQTELNWRCKICNSSWEMSLHDRTSHEQGCPYCAGKRVSEQNSLLTYCNQNGDWGQRLKAEWTGLDSEGNQISMNDITYGSNKSVQWQCIDCGHIWSATINTRATRKTGCPNCCTSGTSYPEQFIYWSLKQLYPDTKNRYLTFQSEQNPKGVEYDVAVLQLPLYIEYSPTYWHRDKVERDNYKKQLCEQHNIRFIQIIEDNYNEYEKMFTENYICIPELTASNKDDYLIKIVSYILNSINHNINEIDIETVKNNALKYSTGSIEYEKSVEFLFPTLAAEWHESNIIKPSEVTPGSASRIKFLCPNCSYKWEVDIHNRVNHQSGCPRCGYNWYKAHTGQPQKIKKQYRKFQEQKFDINTLTSSKSTSEWTEEEDLDI